MIHETVSGPDEQPACTCGTRCWAHRSYWRMLKQPDPCQGELERVGQHHHCAKHGHWADNESVRPTDNAA